MQKEEIPAFVFDAKDPVTWALYSVAWLLAVAATVGIVYAEGLL